MYASNEAGIWQLHAWDVATGDRRQVTDEPVGVIDGTPTLDGEGVLWFQDETGSEAGRWVVQPFAGGETNRSSRVFPTAGTRGWRRLPASSLPASATARGSASTSRWTADRRARSTVVGVGSHRRRRRGWLPARRPLGGRGTPLRRALGARRSHHIRPCACSIHAPGRRSASRSTRDCLSRHGAGRPCPATSGSPSSTSVTAMNGPRSGISRPGSGRISSSTPRARCSSPTGGRTAGRCCSSTDVRAVTAPPLRRVHRRTPRGVR